MKKRLEYVRLLRATNRWLRTHKVTKCPDALGIPMSSLTVVPKSVRNHGVML